MGCQHFHKSTQCNEPSSPVLFIPASAFFLHLHKAFGHAAMQGLCQIAGQQAGAEHGGAMQGRCTRPLPVRALLEHEHRVAALPSLPRDLHLRTCRGRSEWAEVFRLPCACAAGAAASRLSRGAGWKALQPKLECTVSLGSSLCVHAHAASIQVGAGVECGRLQQAANLGPSQGRAHGRPTRSVGSIAGARRPARVQGVQRWCRGEGGQATPGCSPSKQQVDPPGRTPGGGCPQSGLGSGVEAVVLAIGTQEERGFPGQAVCRYKARGVGTRQGHWHARTGRHPHITTPLPS